MKPKVATMSNLDGTCWQILQGDCSGEMNRLQAGCARVVFADPPYNIGVDYGNGAQADQLPDADYLDWCRQWLAACVRLLTDDGSLWVLIGEEYVDHFGIMLREAGVHRRRLITWYETFGTNQRKNFGRCSRFLYYCVRDPRRFVFNDGAVRVPSDRQTKYKDRRADPRGKIRDSVWPFSRLCGTFKERLPGFPTQLPLALLRPVIGCASDPGDLIVDPFAGSATTGVAALEAGRRFVGIEQQEHFARLARERLQAADRGKEKASC
jgi:site-specific DNA-methyltransferase (adenine-specific)